jgi:hypothetical protein
MRPLHVLALTTLLSACSEKQHSTAEEPAAATVDAGAVDAGPPAADVPSEPTADVSKELSGGNGPFLGASNALIVPPGYVLHEYAATGTASSFKADGVLTADGKWTFTTDTTASYTTRVVVLHPENMLEASGITLVEWLNVSGGVDANPEYASLEEELIRKHHTWVGVSAQLIGIEGGPVLVTAPGGAGIAGQGLKKLDAARYGSLAHPGDGFSFDMFTQIARAIRAGKLTDGAKPTTLIAVGESQSAFALTTYYDGVQPLAKVFNGFLIHSRGGSSLPLVAAGGSADLAGSIGSTVHPVFRDDLDAPVFDLQTEGDLTGILNSSSARQPDNDHFRLWEVAGTAHADAHLVGATADSIDCGADVNRGPMHLVVKAGFASLVDWITKHTLPVIAPRIALTSDAVPAVSRDADGIALGGIRTPPVDVPVDVLTGNPGPSKDTICLLFGSTTPLPPSRLAALYTSPADYQQKYNADTDKTIQAGFVLEPDRAALQAFAQPSRIAVPGASPADAGSP